MAWIRSQTRYRVFACAWKVASKYCEGLAAGASITGAPPSGFDSFWPPAAVASFTTFQPTLVPTSLAYNTISAGVPPPAAVVKDHTGPAVLPPAPTPVTLQKYVVLALSEPGEYEELVTLVATCDGGFEVPNATLKEVLPVPGCQLSVGVVLTAVAPLDGAGFDGAAGGPVVPAV